MMENLSGLDVLLMGLGAGFFMLCLALGTAIACGNFKVVINRRKKD